MESQIEYQGNASLRNQHLSKDLKKELIPTCGEWGLLPKGGVWVLTTQKALKRPDWWKGRFALLWMPAISREGRFLFKN